MAGRKGSRSSKTDHVLSLLSGGAKEEPASAPAGQETSQTPVSPQTEGGSPGGEAKPKVQPGVREGGLTAPILQVAKTNNEALSQTIRDALSQALEEELAQQGESVESEPAQPVPTEEPAEEPEQPQPAAQEETAPVPEPEPAPEPVAAPEEAPSPEPVPEPREEPAAPFAPRETRLPDGAVCINVMELLVDERLERYVHMFGLCTCPRCLADVRALALTRLPPKYVVLPDTAATPMLSLYRAKFESQVIAQVIQACKTVMESPRHTQ